MWPDREPTEKPCQLCGRAFPVRNLTRHHCLPRSKGGEADDIELICGPCHAMVHATFTNQALAALYPSIAQLRAAPELAAFVKWVRKQPSTRRTGTKTRRDRL